jgi:hypothetical protein
LTQPAEQKSATPESFFAGLAASEQSAQPDSPFGNISVAVPHEDPSPVEAPVLGSARRIIGGVVFACGVLSILGAHIVGAIDTLLSMPLIFLGYLGLCSGVCLIALPGVADGILRGIKRKLMLGRTPPSRKEVDRSMSFVVLIIVVIALSACHYSTFFSAMP